jgi:uncharacterized membrane-anchored protein
MKQNKIILLLFMVLAVIQLAVPLYMVWQWEDILQTGSQYQWLTAPVDPYDALRGRYMDLRLKDTKGPVLGKANLRYGQTVYAMIGIDAAGYAYISGVSATKPEIGDYVETKAGSMNGNMIYVTVPFKHYYIEEDLATLADKAYQKSAGKDGSVTVRIKNGRGVVEQLYIGTQTIHEYLQSAGEM